MARATLSPLIKAQVKQRTFLFKIILISNIFLGGKIDRRWW
jgi:hypothetical protein